MEAGYIQLNAEEGGNWVGFRHIKRSCLGAQEMQQFGDFGLEQ